MAPRLTSFRTYQPPRTCDTFLIRAPPRWSAFRRHARAADRSPGAAAGRLHPKCAFKKKKKSGKSSHL